VKKIQLSKLTSLLSLLFFGLALWLLRRELHDFRYRDIINFFHNLPADRVIMALAFTVLSYLALTGYDALALRYIGKRIAYWKVALASFAGYAFSNTLGMPLFTGTPLRARLYSGWGMTAIDIATKPAISARKRAPTGRALAIGRCSSSGTAIGSSRNAAPERPMNPSQKVM
jgi:uncharacterized membrane protein YbhN (UPF0104 family)